MSLIDPDGLFHGDRLRRCSNNAQLHWPRLFLASNGFGRIEINYHRIIADAYGTFNPPPPERELMGYVAEYMDVNLLFIFQFNGVTWGQWDAKVSSLPQYKTKLDLRSPCPDAKQFERWKDDYLREKVSVINNFTKVSKCFPYGIGIGVGNGVGKNPCSSNGDELVCVPQYQPESRDLKADQLTGSDQSGEVSQMLLLEETIVAPHAYEPGGSTSTPLGGKITRRRDEGQQRDWFDSWWSIYWRKVAKKAAWDAFQKYITTLERFEQVMAATEGQSPGMLLRDPDKRPHAATWLHGERWRDECEIPKQDEPW